MKNISKYHNREAGFTLIELLLYVSIVGTLLVAITGMLMLSIDARVKNQSMSEVDQQGTAVMDYITQTVRGASSITAPLAGASASSLTLAVPTSGLSPTVLDIVGGVFQVKEGAAAAVPLTNNKVQMTAITFTNLSRGGTNGVVRVSFTLQRISQSGRNQYDYQKTFVTSVALRQ